MLSVCIQATNWQTISPTQVYFSNEIGNVFFLENQNTSHGPTNSTAYPGGRYFYSYNWTWQGWRGYRRCFLKFDLPRAEILPNTRISYIELFLYTPPTRNDGHVSEASVPNNLVFNRITASWSEQTATWNNQPLIDNLTNAITRELPGTRSNPGFEDLVVDVSNILLTNNQTLMPDFHGISMRFFFQENLNGFYRSVNFASHNYSDSTYWPRLKVDYLFPVPQIVQ